MTALRETVDLPGGGRAAYEVVGAGEPMLYFQGGPGFSASMLRDDAELLSDRFAVYLIDPHGAGGSTPPSDPSKYDHLGHARFYDEVRRALGLDQATIMGISFGSIVALTYAALFPERSTRCVAIAARAVGQEEEGEAAGERNAGDAGAARWGAVVCRGTGHMGHVHRPGPRRHGLVRGRRDDGVDPASVRRRSRAARG